MKLLLHICCAPCSASAVKVLEKEFEISFYWYNPNIYDKNEYNKRKEAAAAYAESLGIKFFEEERFNYDYENWKSKSFESCGKCYEIRLEKAALFAKNSGFDCFSTSLLSSPYQKHELVKETAETVAEKNKIKFLYRDFRDGFYEEKNLLRDKGYYVQKYCGCAKSYSERFKK